MKDYPGSGSLNSSISYQRFCLGAANNAGSVSSHYQARIIGAADGYSNGWFNLPVSRSVGWHHGRVSVGAALPDGTNTVSFYIDDMDHPALAHNSVSSYGYNVIEINALVGQVSGYFDDVTFDYLPPNQAGSIGEARTLADGSQVQITGDSVVTLVPATETGFFYAQAPDRSSGILVETSAGLPSVGDKVLLAGTLGTNSDGERVLKGATVTEDGTGAATPLTLANQSVGGAGYVDNSGNTSTFGLSNQGILVRIFGRVTYVDSTNHYFYLDDGSGVDAEITGQSGNLVHGIRVTNTGQSPAAGDFVSSKVSNNRCWLMRHLVL